MKSEGSHNPNQTAGGRWMVVDDNADILMMLREMLSQLRGAEVDGFNSPLAALAAMKAAPGEFELVITDFEMPGMDGAELCRELSNLNPSLKIILATGSGFFTQTATQAAGFNGMLQKPFTVEALCLALEKIGVETKSANLTF